MYRDPDQTRDLALEGGSVRLVHWRGARSASTLLAMHGFTGNALDFEALAWGMPERPIAAIDLPGHGHTRAPDGGWTEATWERALVTLSSNHLPAPIDVLGYSLGARSALALALAAPHAVGRLVLVGGTAGVTEEERAARVVRDEALVARLERDGVQAFLAWWAATPIIASQDDAPSPLRRRQLARKTTLDVPGLSGSLRAFGQGASTSRWDRLGELRSRALLVVGERDEKYLDAAERLSAGWAGARCCIVPDAGHAPHLEQPQAFADLVGSWLDETEGVAA